MARPTKKTPLGGFYGHTVKATPKQFKTLFPSAVTGINDGRDKTNYEIDLETEEGEPFGVYDWKYFRRLKDAEIVTWHISGKNSDVTYKAKQELELLFNN